MELEKCEGCGTTVMVPGRREPVVSGTPAVRTNNPEWDRAAYRAKFAETKEARRKASLKRDEVPRYRYHCPECASERDESRVIPDESSHSGELT